MNAGWFIGLLAVCNEALMWRRHWIAQLQYGADAPTHFEAAAARGGLDEPFFGEFQPSGPGTHWAYIGPRPLLLAFWPLVWLWRRNRPMCCVVWQFLMAACTMAAVGILWPDGMSLGLWCLPLVALVLWSSEDNGYLGAANPLALLVLALAVRAGDPVSAGAWLGFAVALRVWPLAWLPLVMWMQGWSWMVPVFAVGACVWLTAMAWALGFGYDSPARLWRLIVALQTGPIARLVALHKRRPYFLMLAPALVHPGLAAVVGTMGLAYAATLLNTKRHAQECPQDVAMVWFNDWRGRDFKM